MATVYRVALSCWVFYINVNCMFKDVTEHLLPFDIPYTTSGVAVSDVDFDGDFEWIVASYNGPNMVLKYINGQYKDIAVTGSPYENLRDVSGAARGVCACDLTGDGREEIYIVNSNDVYSGPETYTHRLYIWRNGRYEDLYQDQVNKDIPMYAATSVACLDTDGDGRYGFLVTTYSEVGRGATKFIKIDDRFPDHIKLVDVAERVGINFVNGGQGVAVGPVLSNNGGSDIFITNEANTRMGNKGNNNLLHGFNPGTFIDIASHTVSDKNQDGRGISLDDVNQDGLIDIIYGNWLGPHRILLQHRNTTGHTRFQDVASLEFQRSSPVTSVITADFNNDGGLEIFLANQFIKRTDIISSNRLFTVDLRNGQFNIVPISAGDAVETMSSATGAAVGDLDDDGNLEMMICHTGSSSTSSTSSSTSSSSVRVYTTARSSNNWLRILPLTQHGAPARGATVTLKLSDLSKLTRHVNSGSGYMSQMEPVVHFGLGRNYARYLEIVWPNGHMIKRSLSKEEVNVTYVMTYNGLMTSKPRKILRPSFQQFQANGAANDFYKLPIIISITLFGYCILYR